MLEILICSRQYQRMSRLVAGIFGGKLILVHNMGETVVAINCPSNDPGPVSLSGTADVERPSIIVI